MNSNKKPTFKKQAKGTGLSAVGHPKQNIDIKLDKKRIGTIYAPNWQQGKWEVSFAIKKKDIMEDGNPNCEWRWVNFKENFYTDFLAKEFVKEMFDKINSTYEFHYFDD